ncbi:hypothetical protein HPP92_027591 [Vanilla planifolia]|uniref:Uncharacterized protein n=1 Tax=Vanilla planifolia TaxID=51239 RepID=A0A835PBB2_VANPL|nr:hypothetical protein HPP92_027591 [Vanilla planifolia]
MLSYVVLSPHVRIGVLAFMLNMTSGGERGYLNKHVSYVTGEEYIIKMVASPPKETVCPPATQKQSNPLHAAAAASD